MLFTNPALCVIINTRTVPRESRMEYKVIYSVRKTISIIVDDCKIVVKAPIKTDIATIEKLLAKHSSWIEKNIRVQEKKRELQRELTPQEIKELKKSVFARKGSFFCYLTETRIYAFYGVSGIHNLANGTTIIK